MSIGERGKYRIGMGKREMEIIRNRGPQGWDTVQMHTAKNRRKNEKWP
jgi:hypothetical protein